MSFYPYEYFCGANVSVSIAGMNAVEVAALSYRAEESKVPLYGYSSRHFDAVSRGQVLISGSIAINYIHQDYFLQLVNVGRDISAGRERFSAYPYKEEDLNSYLGDERQRSELIREMISPGSENFEIARKLKDKYWNSSMSRNSRVFTPGLAKVSHSLNPHDFYSGLEIKVLFGDRETLAGSQGVTGFLISGVHIVDRGTSIQIDENVIVEEYSFFGRNIHTLETSSDIVLQTSSSGGDSHSEDTIEIKTKTDDFGKSSLDEVKSLGESYPDGIFITSLNDLTNSEPRSFYERGGMFSGRRAGFSYGSF